MDERCDGCRFWRYTEDEFGQCRRYSPRPERMSPDEGSTPATSPDFFTAWPLTFNDDWCGEWQAKPTPPAAAPPPDEKNSPDMY